MNKNSRSILPWPVYVGVTLLLLACNAVGLGSSTVQQGLLQLDSGVVKIQDSEGNWQPLAGDSTFELVGSIESMEPWQVAGRAIERNEATQISDGLEVGDIVRVRGAILGDDDWLAYSIEPAQEETTQTVIIIGKVSSVDPWVVNGIDLNVTGDTVINGDIQPGTLVRVEILLQDDGTWEVISISPLGDLPTTSGCVTVIATVASVNGNQIQFLGWPTTLTVTDSDNDNDNGDDTDNDNDENGNDNEDENGNGDTDVDLTTLKPGQQVLAIVCSDNNQFVITNIIVLDDDNDDNEEGGGEKVLVCHKPSKNPHTLSISSSAVPAHLGHGDTLGACP